MKKEILSEEMLNDDQMDFVVGGWSFKKFFCGLAEGAGIGAVVGVVCGVLGGPVGVAAGAILGSILGGAGDSVASGVTEKTLIE